MAEDLKQMYRTIMDDHFPPQMEISFIDEGQRQTLCYEKVVWTIDNVQKGLRYGENPGQEAALYRLSNGNLVLGVHIHQSICDFGVHRLDRPGDALAQIGGLAIAQLDRLMRAG